MWNFKFDRTSVLKDGLRNNIDKAWMERIAIKKNDRAPLPVVFFDQLLLFYESSIGLILEFYKNEKKE